MHERAYIGGPIELQELRKEHTGRPAPEQQYGTADFRCHSLDPMCCTSGGLDEYSLQGRQITNRGDVASGISAVLCETTRHCISSALISSTN